ncbi:uncharacterized protein EV420DRAFT_1479534 [Desarmillaria tabescens]|uniref:Uncharacterized protein n=1 Tax=Armillaria tabescens TaxID=1929756 RepID=A0AA39N5P8_ARMTA|nr:uncharacterized protein EV420DRAFT_1479534 [Desarmillaria tabescens]KAK0458867.1 hypothetical protein EV420DRAFT_1479534 [Desarmillaria tabescens]
MRSLFKPFDCSLFPPVPHADPLDRNRLLTDNHDHLRGITGGIEVPVHRALPFLLNWQYAAGVEKNSIEFFQDNFDTLPGPKGPVASVASDSPRNVEVNVNLGTLTSSASNLALDELDNIVCVLALGVYLRGAMDEGISIKITRAVSFWHPGAFLPFANFVPEVLVSPYLRLKDLRFIIFSLRQITVLVGVAPHGWGIAVDSDRFRGCGSPLVMVIFTVLQSDAFYSPFLDVDQLTEGSNATTKMTSPLVFLGQIRHITGSQSVVKYYFGEDPRCMQRFLLQTPHRDQEPPDTSLNGRINPRVASFENRITDYGIEDETALDPDIEQRDAEIADELTLQGCDEEGFEVRNSRPTTITKRARMTRLQLMTVGEEIFDIGGEQNPPNPRPTKTSLRQLAVVYLGRVTAANNFSTLDSESDLYPLLNEVPKCRDETTRTFDLDAFKVIYVAPMKVLVQGMVA